MSVSPEDYRRVLRDKVYYFIQDKDSKGLSEYIEDLKSNHDLKDSWDFFVSQLNIFAQWTADNGDAAIMELLLQSGYSTNNKIAPKPEKEGFVLKEKPCLEAMLTNFDLAGTKTEKSRTMGIIEILISHGAKIDAKTLMSLAEIAKRNSEIVSKKFLPLAIEKCDLDLSSLLTLSRQGVAGEPILKTLAMCNPRVMPDPQGLFLEKYQQFYPYYKEAFDRVMLAHHWGIAARSLIGNCEFDLIYSRIEPMIPEMMKSWHHFKSSRECQDVTDQIQQENFAGATTEQQHVALQNIERNVKSIRFLTDLDIPQAVKTLAEEGLVCVPFTSRKDVYLHAEGVMFSSEKRGDNLIIRCYLLNRLGNKPGISIYEVGDPNGIEPFIEYLKSHENAKSTVDFAERQEIDSKLKSLLKIQDLDSRVSYIPMEHQKTHTCTWILMKLFLRAITFEEFYRQGQQLGINKHAEFDVWTCALDASTAFYKTFTLEDRQRTALQYVEDHTDPKRMALADRALLTEVYNRAVYFQRIKKRSIDKALLDRISDTFPEATHAFSLERKLLVDLMSHIDNHDIERIKALLRENDTAILAKVLNHRDYQGNSKGYTPLGYVKKCIKDHENDPIGILYQEISALLESHGAMRNEKPNDHYFYEVFDKMNTLLETKPGSERHQELLKELHTVFVGDPGFFDYLNKEGHKDLLPFEVLEKNPAVFNKLILPFLENVDLVNTAGYTLLNFALKHQCEEAANALIEKGASLMARSPEGKTALILAKEANLVNVAQDIDKKMKAQIESPKSGVYHDYPRKSQATQSKKRRRSEVNPQKKI